MDDKKVVGMNADGTPVYEDEVGQPDLTLSALDRFLRSAGQQLDPIAAASGLWQTVRHPVDTIFSVADTTAANLKDMKDALLQGRGNDARRALVGAVPLFGPAVQSALDQGQEGDVAGMLGSLTGLALPLTSPIKRAGQLARAVAPTAAEATALKMEGVAARKAADVITPQRGANQARFATRAQKIAPELLDSGALNTWSRTGAADNVFAGLQDAKAALDDVVDARWASPEIAAKRATGEFYNPDPLLKVLKQKRDALYAEPIEGSRFPKRSEPAAGMTRADQLEGGTLEVPTRAGAKVAEPIGTRVLPPNKVARLEQLNLAIKQIEQLGPQVPYESLRQLRQDFDITANQKYYGAIAPDLMIKAKGAAEGAADVTGAMREHLASLDPATAEAYAKYSLYKSADDLRQAVETSNIGRPHRGSTIAARLIGAGVGAKAAGIPGAVGGYVLGPILEAGMELGVTPKLKLATALNDMADAIRVGNTSKAGFYANLASRIAQVGVLTDRQTSPAKQGPTDVTPYRGYVYGKPTDATPEAIPAEVATVLTSARPGQYTLGPDTYVVTLDGSVRKVGR